MTNKNISNENNFYKSEEYFQLIDVTKLFCAILVVLIHCLGIPSGHPVTTFIVKCFSAQAVPFFMIASGFFAAKKISREMNWTKITKLCIKNWLLIYCIWSILWLPYYIEYSCGSKSQIQKFGNQSSSTRKSPFLCLITCLFLWGY